MNIKSYEHTFVVPFQPWKGGSAPQCLMSDCALWSLDCCIHPWVERKRMWCDMISYVICDMICDKWVVICNMTSDMICVVWSVVWNNLYLWCSFWINRNFGFGASSMLSRKKCVWGIITTKRRMKFMVFVAVSGCVCGMWWLYGGYMVAIWWLYGGYMVAIWLCIAPIGPFMLRQNVGSNAYFALAESNFAAFH